MLNHKFIKCSTQLKTFVTLFHVCYVQFNGSAVSPALTLMHRKHEESTYTTDRSCMM